MPWVIRASEAIWAGGSSFRLVVVGIEVEATSAMGRAVGRSARYAVGVGRASWGKRARRLEVEAAERSRRTFVEVWRDVAAVADHEGIAGGVAGAVNAAVVAHRDRCSDASASILLHISSSRSSSYYIDVKPRRQRLVPNHRRSWRHWIRSGSIDRFSIMAGLGCIVQGR